MSLNKEKIKEYVDGCGDVAMIYSQVMSTVACATQRCKVFLNNRFYQAYLDKSQQREGPSSLLSTIIQQHQRLAELESFQMPSYRSKMRY